MSQFARVPWPRVLGVGLVVFGITNLFLLMRPGQDLQVSAVDVTPIVTTTVIATTVTRPVTAPTAAERASVATKVRISTATQAELETLPGIGPTKAQAIIDYRNENGFKSINDLEKVKGIGAKTMEKLRPLIDL